MSEPTSSPVARVQRASACTFIWFSRRCFVANSFPSHSNDVIIYTLSIHERRECGACASERHRPSTKEEQFQFYTVLCIRKFYLFSTHNSLVAVVESVCIIHQSVCVCCASVFILISKIQTIIFEFYWIKTPRQQQHAKIFYSNFSGKICLCFDCSTVERWAQEFAEWFCARLLHALNGKSWSANDATSTNTNILRVNWRMCICVNGRRVRAIIKVLFTLYLVVVVRPPH